jgi:hypothetical protein
VRRVIEQGYRDFYRLVHDDPPPLIDLTSNLAQGKELPTDLVAAAVWDGLSVQSTMAQARRKSRASPMLGRFVAVLRVPLDGTIRFERTLRTPGHFTIWGEPAILRALVVSVIPA